MQRVDHIVQLDGNLRAGKLRLVLLLDDGAEEEQQVEDGVEEEAEVDKKKEN